MFRKEALDQLASPEQLDQIMKTTTPRAWAMLTAAGLLLATALVWGIFGSIATRVTGVGMLIKSGGVLNVVALGAGQLSALYVEVGDEVQRGQIIARIAQPELEQEIERAKAKLIELERAHEMLLAIRSAGQAAMSGYVAKERGSLSTSIGAARERLAEAREAYARKSKLYAQGLVLKQALIAAKDDIRAAQEAIDRTAAQMGSLSLSSQESKGEKEKEVLASERGISDAQRQISLLEERLELTSQVVSANAGRVLEVRAREGDVVDAARPIISLEPSGTEGTGLEALIYLPLAKGKMVNAGMRAQISPDGLRREEFGAMLGIVTSVSEFPSTEEGMKRILGNDLLVQKLLDTVGLAPVAVRAELVPDFETKSGYRWSSRDGPPIVIGPGAPCTAMITVRRSRPIDLVIPLLREYAGL